MRIDIDLDIILKPYFQNYKVSQLSGGSTNDELFKIEAQGQNYILKKQVTSLKNEYLNYNWLLNKVPIPQIVFYYQHNQFDLLCMTELHGQTLAHCIGKINDKEIIRNYASTLRMLHSISIDKKALVQNLDDRLLMAQYNI